MIYLDYQATTPLAPEAREAMLAWLGGPDSDGGFANPAAPYRIGRAASVTVEMARDEVAALLPKGGRVIFTSGATEAINWALRSAAKLKPGGVTASAIEHAAVLQCVEAMAGALVPVSSDGIAVVPDAFPENGIAALMLVNNEIGTIQPVTQWVERVHAAGGLLLCDAVQGFGRIAIPEGPDLIAVTAHKIHGPKGIGALWIRDGIDLPPMMLGGAQEMGMRAGTVSPALVAGFGAAARVARERMAADAAHAERLWAIAQAEMAGWNINGSMQARWHGNLNLRLEGVNATRLLSDARGVAFTLGSACGSGSGRSSHVLRAIGLSETEARASIRLGWGRFTSEADLREGLGAIKSAAELQKVPA
jgi:cysteine desulfurase